MDDFELPAFLRKQDPVVATPKKLLARAIIRAFHEAIDDGVEYRQAVRLLANVKFDVPLETAIEAAKKVVKTPLKAWSCLLMWASNEAEYTHGLNDHTLLLVMGQLSVVSEADQVKANALIERLMDAQVTTVLANP